MTVFAECSGFFLLGIDNPGIIQRQWKKAIQKSCVAGIWYWIENMLPQHFGRSNFRRYGESFKKRKVSTQKRRAKKWGTTAYLVNYPIGQPPADRPTLERMMVYAIPTFATTPSGAHATWATPGIQEQYKNEATAMNEEDAQELARFFHASMMEKIGGGEVKFRKRVKHPFTRESWKRFRRLKVTR